MTLMSLSRKVPCAELFKFKLPLNNRMYAVECEVITNSLSVLSR